MALPGGIILADGGFPEAPIREGFVDHVNVEDANVLWDGGHAALAGVVIVPEVTPMPDGLVGEPILMHGDVFYNQIWIIPTSLQATNPKLDTPILFKIWNAFLFDNELLSIEASGDTVGLTLAIEPGDVLGALGLRTTSITIDDSAPLTITADFLFVFELDTGNLHFTSSRAFVIADVPETPIVETWAWWTNIIVSDDGTEQRICLRELPRRTFRESIQYTEVDALRAQANLMFGYFATPLIAPLFQHSTRLKAKGITGNTSLTFNEARTDLRSFGLAFLYDANGYQIIQLGAVDTDGAAIAYPLERDFRIGAMICPATIVMPGNNSGMNRLPADNAGSLDLSLVEQKYQKPFLRASNAQVLTTFAGLPILDRNAVGRGFDQAYDTGSQVRDYGGVIEVRAPWQHTQIQMPRTYLSQRVLNPDDWDWWRVFADYTKGSVNPFYTATYREDFALVEAAEPASSDITVGGTDYGTYYEFEPFKQIAILTDAGIHYTAVTALAIIGGDTKIFFDPPLPAGVDWGTNQRVSMLVKCRVANDQIVCNHYDTHTELSIILRTVDE